MHAYFSFAERHNNGLRDTFSAEYNALGGYVRRRAGRFNEYPIHRRRPVARRGLREMAKLASDMSNPAMTSVISTSSSVNPAFRYLIAMNRYPHHFPRRLVVHPRRS